LGLEILAEMTLNSKDPSITLLKNERFVDMEDLYEVFAAKFRIGHSLSHESR
jgi:hypothetical protein